MDWKPLERNLLKESRHRKCLPFKRVTQHPLIVQQSNETTKNVIKTLSNLSINNQNLTPAKSMVQTSWGGLDPLSAAAAAATTTSDLPSPSFEKPVYGNLDRDAISFYVESDFYDWERRQTDVLNKCTGGEKLSLITSEMMGSINLIVKSQNTVSLNEKVRLRLNQLDDFEGVTLSDLHNLTRQEFVAEIERLHSTMQEAWKSEQRVQAVKITIQCARLLANSFDSAVFYPSKFALISRVLDLFGNLVHERIKRKCSSAGDIENAQITCQNWFFKVATIRELLPRIYLEISIFRSYSFIISIDNWPIDARSHLIRLNNTIRGLADPLVAIFVQSYLAKTAFNLFPKDKDIFYQIYFDIISRCSKIRSSFESKLLNKSNLSSHAYYELFFSPLDWISSCILYKADSEMNMKVMGLLENGIGHKCLPIHVLLLKTFFVNANVECVIRKIDRAIRLMEICFEQQFKFSVDLQLLPAFANILSSAKSIEFDLLPSEKRQILNEIWIFVAKLQGNHYVQSVKAILPFIVQHFSLKEFRTVLEHLVARFTGNGITEEFQTELLHILNCFLRLDSDDAIRLMSLEVFRQFFELLHDQNHKVEACKLILDKFLKYVSTLQSSSSQGSPSKLSSPNRSLLSLTDPTQVNGFFNYCKIVHDSINSFSLDDERRQTEQTLLDFIRLVDFGDDLETQLNFLIEFRANFGSSERITTFLIMSANQLAIRWRNAVRKRRRHMVLLNKEFVQACLAFAIVTIPSVERLTVQLQLYLQSAQVALQCCCLSQTDFFLKSAITLLSKLSTESDAQSDLCTRPNESFLQAYLGQLLSFMLLVPDNPQNQPLQLLHGVLNVLSRWDGQLSSEFSIKVYLNLLHFLCAASQSNYAYHIQGVTSNDELYGGDEQFQEEIVSLGSVVIERILSIIKDLGEKNQFQKQSSLALDTLHTLIISGDVRSCWKLIFNLWQLACKSGEKTRRDEIVKVIEFIEEKSVEIDSNLGELANKMRNHLQKTAKQV